MTKLKKWKKYTFLSQKMTKSSIFDKIEEAKKYTSLSQNDKMGQFWQKLFAISQHIVCTHSILMLISWFEVHFSNMTKWTIFDKIEKVKKKIHFPLLQNDKIEKAKKI